MHHRLLVTTRNAPALPRSGPQHRHPSHRWRGRFGSYLCSDAPARLPLRPTHPEPGRAQALRLRSGLGLAGARAVHRRPSRREADHRALGRCAAADGLGADRDGQRLAHAPAPRRLPQPERLGPRSTRDRPHRAHALHLGLAGDAPAQAASYGRAEQGRSPATRWPVPSASTGSGACATAPPRRSSTAPVASPWSRRPSPVEHGVSRSRAGRLALLRRGRARCLARPCRTARLAAHQPHRRLSLECRDAVSTQTGSGLFTAYQQPRA